MSFNKIDGMKSDTPLELCPRAAEIKARSQEQFARILEDPVVCAALDRWRSTQEDFVMKGEKTTVQETTEQLRAALGEAQSDKERLTQRLDALQRRTVDRNPLCRGCEYWRRLIATMAGVGWFILLLAACHKIALKYPERVANVPAPFPAPELHLFARAIASGKPDKLAGIFGGLFGPYLGVLAHWEWLLWRHGQSTMPQRMVEALRGLWQRLRVRLTPHPDQH